MEKRTTSSTGGQKGVKLQRHDLIPSGPLNQLAEHFGRGALKYDDHQWRKGYEWSKSYSAIQRHLLDFWAGLDYDVCSNTDGSDCTMVAATGDVFLPIADDTCYNHTGSHHLVAAAWHSFVLLEFTVTHPGHDDRYKPNVAPDPEPDIYQYGLWSVPGDYSSSSFDPQYPFLDSDTNRPKGI